MKIKLITLLFFPILFFSQEKDIKLLDIVFKDSINYYSFYHDNSQKHDEITTSKNVSLITKTIGFERINNCKKEGGFKIYDDDIVISNDMLYPYHMVRKYHIDNSVRHHLSNYFENNKLTSEKIKRKQKYTLLKVTQQKVIILIFETSIQYFNTISNNLKLNGNNSKIKIYKILNGSDEDLINQWSEKY